MSRFILVRHGKTQNNEAGRLSGWIDTPLTDDGLVPTENVIQKLANTNIDKIVSSDLGRAFITAYVIGRAQNFQGEIVRLPGLREVSYGDAGNMKSAEAYERFPGLDSDTHYTPPNGESLDQMQARVLKTILELDSEQPNCTCLVVAHSGVMAALRSNYTGQDFGAHNISEAYAHDYVASITVDSERVTSFEEIT